jgi:arylsulfatase A-like enzyme
MIDAGSSRRSKRARRVRIPVLGRKIALLACMLGFPLLAADEAARSKPNFVIIFADDLGYGDLGCYGSRTIKTPRLDRMAAEGMRFPDFYAQPVCGPSRASLLTGCYPVRVATHENKVEIMPRLHAKEITIAEMLQEAGYTSAAIGKWHLAGHSQTAYTVEHLPTRQGFDLYFGTPSSNDAVANLLRDEVLIERDVDMSTLTSRYTDEAIAFIRKNKARPFFVYLAHSMPHTRLGVSGQFRGKSTSLYGDVVEELDWHVGRLLDTLETEALDHSTYVIFTSDNGPWFLDRHLLAPEDRRTRNPQGALAYPFTQRDERGAHGGSAGPLRGAKTSVWEGGFRVPCIVRAPGRVPAGTVCNELATTLDFFPTFAQLAGGRTPTDRVIDGHDITPLLRGAPGAKTPTTEFYYYQRHALEAVRAGRWKLHLPRPEDELWAIYLAPADSAEVKQPMLFNLEADVAERRDVAAAHPDVVARLLALAEKARVDLGDHDRVGEGVRYFDPQPKRPDIAAARRVGP